jgi:hypothetical protein
MDVISDEERRRRRAAITTTPSQAPRSFATSCRRSRWTAITAIAAVLTLVYAAPFGAVNQATYLLDPLHRATPELFARDWFVSETPSYMPVFGWLAQWLFVIDPEGPLAFVTAHVIVSIASYVAIYSIVAAVGGRVQAFAITAGFITVTKGISMGGSYLFAGYLQPSSLAMLGWFVALAAFVRARYLTCGLAAACAGVVHANFLVLGVGLFTLAALARRDVSWRDHAKLLAPQLVVLACFGPMLAESAGPSERAITILAELHAPVHYAPHRLLWWLTGVLCWQLAGRGAMFVLADNQAARVLWRFSLVAAALCCTTALLVQLEPLRFLVQLFVPRVAPFAQLACIILVAAALVRQALQPQPLSRTQRAMLVIGIVVALLVYGWQVRGMIAWPALVTACALTTAIVVAPQIAHRVAIAFAALALAFAIIAVPHGRGPTTKPYGTVANHELYEWARTKTPVDALFVIPPGNGHFRLLARRAVVVDAKSPPLRPDLLEQWYARLCAALLVEPGLSARELAARYGKLTPDQLREVARTFDADYIVADRNLTFGAYPIFRNAKYAVYRVSDDRDLQNGASE